MPFTNTDITEKLEFELGTDLSGKDLRLRVRPTSSSVTHFLELTSADGEIYVDEDQKNVLHIHANFPVLENQPIGTFRYDIIEFLEDTGQSRVVGGTFPIQSPGSKRQEMTVDKTSRYGDVVGVISAPKGPTGEKGEKGDTGDKGPTGTQGNTTFDTLALALANIDLFDDGDILHTLGHTTAGDGGGFSGPVEAGDNLNNPDGDRIAYSGSLFPLINVRAYGAKGDGSSDDGGAIAKADAFAASQGGSVFFPAGDYRADELAPTANWCGTGEGSVIRNIDALATEGVVKVEGRSGLRFSNFTIDGGVSADPGSWSSSNFDSFTGAVPLFLKNSSNIVLTDIFARNAFWSGVRVENCSDVALTRVHAKACRGRYGDGFYIRDSRRVSVVQCRAVDYTRIGFVTEGGMLEASFTACFARNGHDASLLFGDTELNAGFWFENSAHISANGCFAFDNTHRGFVFASGTVPENSEERGGCDLTNCHSFAAGHIGFFLGSAFTTPALVSATGCTSWGSEIGFYGGLNNGGDTIRLMQCHAQVTPNGVSKNVAGYYWVTAAALTIVPLFIVESCTVGRDAHVDDAADVASTSSNSADVSTFAGGNARVVVSGLYRPDGGQVSFKTRSGSADISLRNIKNLNIVNATMSSGEIHDCKIKAANMNGTNVLVRGGAIDGQVSLAHTGLIRVLGTNIAPGSDSLDVIRTISDARPLIEIRNCPVVKDVATDGYAIRIQEEGATKPLLIMSDLVMYNSGAAAAGDAFVWIVRSGTPYALSGIVSDDTSNAIKINTTIAASPDGVTNAAMH